MHELSIAASIVDVVTESASAYPGARVKQVRLCVGALASVVEDSLQFCWGLATEDSPLAGAALVIRKLPLVVHCRHCGVDVEIEGVQSLRCPRCGALAADLRQGRELEIESIELEEPDPGKSDFREQVTGAANPAEQRRD
jgi:hydrogenase nickel incorporation protein HypA/HybF